LRLEQGALERDDPSAPRPVRKENAMTVSEISTLARSFTTAPQRETLEKYLPVILAIAVAWLLARGLRKMFWTAFGLYWAFQGMHGFRIWH
jgi:hypothetical protein